MSRFVPELPRYTVKLLSSLAVIAPKNVTESDVFDAKLDKGK
jgi:hypothetical protein